MMTWVIMIIILFTGKPSEDTVIWHQNSYDNAMAKQDRIQDKLDQDKGINES